jgi:hypothetical protein
MTSRTRVGGWSRPASGLRGRLLASAADGSCGTTIQLRVDVELENVSDVGNPLEILWEKDEALVFRLTDASGAAIATAPASASITEPGPHWITLPVRSSLRMDVTTYGYAVRPNLRLFIGLAGMRTWQIEANDAGRYRLGATLTSQGPADGTRNVWRCARAPGGRRPLTRQGLSSRGDRLQRPSSGLSTRGAELV